MNEFIERLTGKGKSVGFENLGPETPFDNAETIASDQSSPEPVPEPVPELRSDKPKPTARQKTRQAVYPAYSSSPVFSGTKKQVNAWISRQPYPAGYRAGEL